MDLHGPTIGQTGTSTRHELMAWMSVLAKPIRTMFATDSAAMLNKAKQLLEKAEQREEARTKGKPVKSGCPFKKPWRLQTDGDLWEIVWEAIHTRGLSNQDLRKVKGHATEEDVREGRSTHKDREGNDRSDKNADQGVEQLAGEGLVKLGTWVANRQDQYKKFVARIHRMIAAVTKAEKEERSRAKAVDQQLLGYDPEKWVETDLRLDRSLQDRRAFSPLDLQPPVVGVHRFDFCQHMFEEVHAFLRAREWAPINPEDGVAGTTWIELFALFDKSGMRSKRGEHVLNPEVKQRAVNRKLEQAAREVLPKNYAEHAAIIRPALDAELTRFKAIVRHIARHELQDKQAEMFTMDDNSRFRRLAKLGVYGHQPGIAAHIKTSLEEEQDVVVSIIGQKVGSNPKTVQACKDQMRTRSEGEDGNIKVKICQTHYQIDRQMEPSEEDRRGTRSSGGQDPGKAFLCKPPPYV